MSEASKLRNLPETPRAKHELISDHLLSRIEDGRWCAGDKLPSEDQLARELGYSLGTVQRALRSLVDMGVVERRQGSGTFVTGSQVQQEHLRHFRFKAEGGAKILPVYFEVLDAEITQETGPWTGFFDSGADTSSGDYVRIRRLISVNHEFEIFSELYLPSPRFAELVKSSVQWLDGVSIRDMLNARFNAPTLKHSQTVRCEALPPRVCRAIKVSAGQYGIVWTITGTSFRDSPISWQRVFIPPSDRILEIESERTPEIVK